LSRRQRQLCIRDSFDESCRGRTFEILLEKPGRQRGQLIGRSPYLQSVVVNDPPAAIGDLLTVTITDVGPNSLAGIPVEASDRSASQSPASSARSRPLAAMEA
ncbi:TRAM domain-containing protein, partial [Xanthobacter autotrophicus]